MINLFYFLYILILLNSCISVAPSLFRIVNIVQCRFSSTNTIDKKKKTLVTTLYNNRCLNIKKKLMFVENNQVFFIA